MSDFEKRVELASNDISELYPSEARDALTASDAVLWELVDLWHFFVADCPHYPNKDNETVLVLGCVRCSATAKRADELAALLAPKATK